MDEALLLFKGMVGEGGVITQDLGRCPEIPVRQGS